MNRFKSTLTSAKLIIKALLRKETDPYTRMGLAKEVADDISGNCFKHGDLGGVINAITFYADDTVRAEFLRSGDGRRCISKGLRSQGIPELVPLADGIERGPVRVLPLREAEGRGERIHRLQTEGPSILYEVYARSAGTDCIITVGKESFRLSGIEKVDGQYPFGRDSSRPKRTNSFTFKEEWDGTTWGDVSRAQGAFYNDEQGRWYLVCHSDPQMKLNGRLMTLGMPVELSGKGSIHIDSHVVRYTITGPEEAEA